MPVIHTGYSFTLYASTVKTIVINSTLTGLELSSELAQYSYLQPVKRLPNAKRIKISEAMASSLQALYIYDTGASKWRKELNFSVNNSILTLDKLYHGIIVGFPFDVLKDDFYKDGEYIYQLFMSISDDRIYKNITVSASSFCLNNFISLFFATNNTGPWYNSLSSYSILESFYVKVKVANFSLIDDFEIIPSEIINISCLVCE